MTRRENSLERFMIDSYFVPSLFRCWIMFFRFFPSKSQLRVVGPAVRKHGYVDSKRTYLNTTEKRWLLIGRTLVALVRTISVTDGCSSSDTVNFIHHDTLVTQEVDDEML